MGVNNEGQFIAVVRLMTGSDMQWEGALNVRASRLRKIGVIAVPGTAYYDRRALAELQRVHSVDYLTREGYFDRLVLLPERSLKRKDLEGMRVIIGGGRGEHNAVLTGEERFWQDVENGHPAVLGEDLSTRIVEWVNSFPEIKREGGNFEISGDGRVFLRTEPVGIESR